MSLQSDLAFKHREERIRVGAAARARVVGLWRHADIANLDGSWDRLAPEIVQTVNAAQTVAAKQATPYLNAVDRSYGRNTPTPELVPAAFSGVTLDGREVGPALYTAVTTTKSLIGQGVAPYTAFQSGLNALSVVAYAAIQDMGRQADITLGNAREYTYYVRVVGGSACSRCAILAGIRSGRDAFLRHTSCQCTAMPVTEKAPNKVPSGFHTSPEAYFESLSNAEQDRVFTKAGAEAIRAGASPISVVNARRGAYGIGYSGHYNVPVTVGTRNSLQPLTIGRKPDGSPLRVFATTEGTTARGSFYRAERRRGAEAMKDGRYRRTTSIRLMPEQLIKMAGGNHTRLVELLTRYGYMQ